MNFSRRILVITSLLMMLAQKVRSGCLLGGHNYQVGEVWHPRLQNTASNYCVTCRCVVDQNGDYDYDCTSERCPEGCSGGPDQGECCSICSAPADEASRGTSSSNAGSAEGDPHPSGSRGSVPGETSFRVCVVGGMLYNHGDTFSSNYSDAEDEKCEQCYCTDGVTHCRTKTCPSVFCPSPIYSRKDCCRLCPDDSTELDWDTMVSFTDHITTRGRSNNDCKSGGRYFVNGSIWHPIVGPFGEMDCVMCKCYNGRIDCSRLKCQSREKLQCDKPVKVVGQCCPVCPIDPEPYLNGTRVQCLDSRSSVAVWKNGAGLTSEVLHYVFQPVDGFGELKMHRLILKDRNLQKLDIMSITVEEFTELKSKFVFSLLGGSTDRLVKKLEKRHRKLESRCKDANKASCKPHLTRLEETLKIKPPQERMRCARGEKEI